MRRLRAWLKGRTEPCRAVHLVNEIVRPCAKKSEHFASHVSRYWIHDDNYANRPQWKSRVVLRWSPWERN